MKPSIPLDKYARDSRAWLDFAKVNYASSRELFTCDNKIITCFTAATLGHIALEMFLKSALIAEGFTVFNPKNLDKLDPSFQLRKQDCIWSHDLIALAKQLETKRPEFDLSDISKIPQLIHHEHRWCLEDGFRLFDLFFSELRYPQKLESLNDVGPSDILILDSLVDALQPFLGELSRVRA